MKALTHTIGFNAFDFIQNLPAETTVDQHLEIIKQGVKVTLHSAIIVGYSIEQLKSKTDHGRFLEELKKCNLKEDSAQQYKSIYKKFTQIKDTRALENLSLLPFGKLRELASCPPESIAEFGASLPRVKKALEMKRVDFRNAVIPFIKRKEVNLLDELEETIELKEKKEQALQEKIEHLQNDLNKYTEIEDTHELVTKYVETHNHISTQIMVLLERLEKLQHSVFVGKHNNTFLELGLIEQDRIIFETQAKTGALEKMTTNLFKQSEKLKTQSGEPITFDEDDFKRMKHNFDVLKEVISAMTNLQLNSH